ncbi:MAG: molybdopterin molybdotransferase MoeA [SAR202 cluster bacterium]|nr:molybdopterin molybdotransferase MoeA [SAR202 cluster bacterium]
MLSVEQALERVLALVHRLPAARVPLLDADGLVLAEDIAAPFDIPTLANSGMDGYAVRSVDVRAATEASPVILRVAGQVRAGELPAGTVERGTSYRIMTGAPMPPGADAVVPWEATDETQRRKAGGPIAAIAIKHAPSPNENVRPAGEDVRRGSLLMQSGHVLTPPAIGVLASFGLATVPVIRRPRVAILATGDEVLTPGEAPQSGRLFDSNSYATAAAVRRWGGEPVLLGIARDNMDSLRAKLRAGLDADLLLTSAGVSAGAFDMVKEALTEIGAIDFWSVRMRPSRPIAFGLLRAPDGRQVPHLGLPGNPVSALVAMVEFGRPALAKMMGRDATPLPTVQAVLDAQVTNPDGRRVFARVMLERRGGMLHARPTGAQGSNLLTSMVLAHGLAICHEDTPRREAGETVTVHVLDWLNHAHLWAGPPVLT